MAYGGAVSFQNISGSSIFPLPFYITGNGLNRNMQIEIKPQSRINLNGALEVIQEDKHSGNGKSMEETKRDK